MGRFIVIEGLDGSGKTTQGKLLADRLRAEGFQITQATVSRDIRDLNVQAKLDNDVIDIADLKEGMILNGTVRNIIDFGAFVDIGVHQDGLVHISQISSKYIKHPLDVLKIGDIVKVKVISLDIAKKRIGLSIKEANQ